AGGCAFGHQHDFAGEQFSLQPVFIPRPLRPAGQLRRRVIARAQHSNRVGVDAQNRPGVRGCRGANGVAAGLAHGEEAAPAAAPAPASSTWIRWYSYASTSACHDASMMLVFTPMVPKISRVPSPRS